VYFPKECKCVQFEICEIDQGYLVSVILSNRLRYLSLLSRQILSKDGISKVIRRRLAERYDAFACRDTRWSGAPGTLQRRIIIRLGIFVHSTYVFPLFPSRLKNTNDRTKKEKKSELRRIVNTRRSNVRKKRDAYYIMDAPLSLS